MSHIFNISSRGGAATVFMTKLLNDNGAVCFHALREAPFAQQAETVSPDAMAKGLKRLQEATYADRPVGVVHSFYDAERVRPAFVGNGGRFFTLFRHPVNRIVSLFNHHVGLEFSEIQEARAGFFEDLLELMVSDEEKAVRILRLFQTIVRDVLIYDIDCYHSSAPEEVIYFEKLTTSPDYAREVIAQVTGFSETDIKVPEQRLRRKVNTHSHSQVACFSELPPVLQAVVLDIASAIGLDILKKTYSGLGYGGNSIFLPLLKNAAPLAPAS